MCKVRLPSHNSYLSISSSVSVDGDINVRQLLNIIHLQSSASSSLWLSTQKVMTTHTPSLPALHTYLILSNCSSSRFSVRLTRDRINIGRMRLLYKAVQVYYLKRETKKSKRGANNNMCFPLTVVRAYDHTVLHTPHYSISPHFV